MSVCTFPLLFITIVSRNESLILLLSIVKFKLGCKVYKLVKFSQIFIGFSE